ncbi:MAG: hypothetical protein BHW64_00555 [Candidatus Melainabacteria bacterium LEY3_CP_29_8]|nr:MAG: hypothetical protein BHW64_00555 [Candidatus Melainabacteria bacterium LEY3_CP_29_8]
MSNYVIGKVIGVFGDSIDIALDNYLNDSGVPENMIININTEQGPEPILIGQPGTFLKIQISNGMLLCMVSGIKMKDTTNNSTDSISVDLPNRILTLVPFGTINENNIFEKGSDVLPTINNYVYAVSSKTINTIYSNFSEGNFTLGKLSLMPQQDALINLDSFLSRHGAILGQTGSGKSWTVASFLQKIANLKQSTVVLLDLHGEYKNAFGDYADYIDASSLELPYWLMNCEELLDLMVDKNENAAPNQTALFKTLLQQSKQNHPENQELAIPKINVDTPVYFDFNEILNKFRRLDTEMVEGSRGPKKGDFNGQFSRLLTRIDSKLNDVRYNLIFKPQIYNTSASMSDLFKKILGEEEIPKKIVIIDMSPIPFDVRTSVISLLLRCFFDFCYWYKKINEESYPLAIFCDEAHLYLNEYDSSSKSARLSAERIAKEGRKYGASLTIISQRPREVSATILSQCNTFLCLRITNPDDQSYVKRLLPDSLASITTMFSSLRRGECILLGDSVIMPTRIKIDKPNPTPDSEDTSFYKKWNMPHEEIDIPSVLDAWRKQKA